MEGDRCGTMSNAQPWRKQQLEMESQLKLNSLPFFGCPKGFAL
jgi:hypothetical protein